MEPLTVASTFATIVSLLRIWKSERTAAKQQTVDQFVEWLRRREFSELADTLRNNKAAMESIADLLATNHEEMMEQLAVIEGLVTDLAAKAGQLEPLASAFGAGSRISDQAISLLRQMNEGDTSAVLEAKRNAGDLLMRLDGTGEHLEVNEPRFLDDDLEKLCDYGLVRLDYNSSGSRIFRITRDGAAIGRR